MHWVFRLLDIRMTNIKALLKVVVKHIFEV